MTAPRCEYPGCRDSASRKFPEMIVRAGRTCCIFRLFCADHVPADVMHMTAPVRCELPTHARPTGQIHVPRVWEITGKPPRDWKKSPKLMRA